MPGAILAVQLGEWQELSDGVVDTGYRVILSTQRIQMNVQTTTFWGQQILMATGSPWGVGTVDTGSISVITQFTNFLGQFTDKRRGWGQFVNVPYNPSYYLARTYVIAVPEAEPPESAGPMILLASGYDPLKGWWVTFKGNFRLHIPIFQDFCPVENQTPDYSIKIR